MIRSRSLYRGAAGVALALTAVTLRTADARAAGEPKAEAPAAAASAPATTPAPSTSSSAPSPASKPSTPEQPALKLSLREAIERAQVHSPDVVIARYAVREARAQRVGAGIIMPENPRVEIDGRPAITGGDLIGDLGYAAALSMLFDVGGAPGARVREADRAADLAGKSLAVQRLRARTQAWKAYLQARVAEKRLEETKALVEIAERILRASRQRAEAGASGDIEQSIATVDLSQLRASIEEASRQREQHASALRQVLDLPPEKPLVLTTPLEEPPPAPDKKSLADRALKARPEFAQIRARIALLDAREERLERENFPKMGLYAGVDAAPISPIFGVLGLVVELPVARRNQGKRAVTAAARATEAERLELQARAVVRAVTSARDVYELRRNELRVLTDTTLPAAERTLKLVEAGWLAGSFDVFRLAQAARDVQRVRARRLDALEAAWLARIDLDRAVGGGSL